MIKKLFFSLILIFLFLFGFIPSFAQDEIPLVDNNLGGEAKCIIRGKGVPLKSGTTDGNRLLLIQAEGVTSGSILLQRVAVTPEFTIDASTQTFFGLIEDVDGFLAGKRLDFESSTSDLGLKKIVPGKGTVEVTNIFDDGTRGKVKGAIQLKSSTDNLATGKVKLLYEKTIRKVTDGGGRRKSK